MKSYDELQFRDDFMFGAVLKNADICKKIIEIVLDIEIERIEYIERQKTIDIAYASKGVRIDVYVKDENHSVYSVDMQQEDDRVMPKRARYYQSISDLDLIQAGESYDELNDSFVIFFCCFDPFGYGHYKYTFTNDCHEG